MAFGNAAKLLCRSVVKGALKCCSLGCVRERHRGCVCVTLRIPLKSVHLGRIRCDRAAFISMALRKEVTKRMKNEGFGPRQRLERTTPLQSGGLGELHTEDQEAAT